MRPDRFFINEDNQAAYDLGYKDGLKDGRDSYVIDEAEIRNQIKEELQVEYDRIRDLRSKLKEEYKQRKVEKRQLAAWKNYLRKQTREEHYE
jgi:hypothetical protein